MILHDVQLPNRSNDYCLYQGSDTLEVSSDHEHFLCYPHAINYRYNSRGFRDTEWPDSLHELKNAIWCVGDSFTVGLGSAYEHIWPQVLQKIINQRTINVSMDGASNNWIARQAGKILNELSPKTMVIHWSYIHRREVDLNQALDKKWKIFYNDIRGSDWPDCDRSHYHSLPLDIRNEIDQIHGGWNDFISDEDRRVLAVSCSDQEDIRNTVDCVALVESYKSTCKIIHSFIPQFVPMRLKGTIESQVPGLVIPETVLLDLARDGHHYDVLTSNWLVDQIQRLL